MAINRFAGKDTDFGHGTTSDHTHLEISRCDQHVSGQNPIAIAGLAYTDRTGPIEPSGIGTREPRRHMDDYHSPGCVRWKSSQDFGQGFGPPSRGEPGQ